MNEAVRTSNSPTRKKEARLTIILEPGQGKKEEIFDLELAAATSAVSAMIAVVVPAATVAAALPRRFTSRAGTRARRFASLVLPRRFTSRSTLLPRHRTFSHHRRADSHRFGIT